SPRRAAQEDIPRTPSGRQRVIRRPAILRARVVNFPGGEQQPVRGLRGNGAPGLGIPPVPQRRPLSIGIVVKSEAGFGKGGHKLVYVSHELLIDVANYLSQNRC